MVAETVVAYDQLKVETAVRLLQRQSETPYQQEQRVDSFKDTRTARVETVG